MQTRHPDVLLIDELPCGLRNRNALLDHYEKRRREVLSQDQSFVDFLACGLIFELSRTTQTERLMHLLWGVVFLPLGLPLFPFRQCEQRWCG